MSANLVEKLNLPANVKDKVISPYHKPGWISACQLGQIPPKARMTILSLNRLPNPNYDWTLEAYRVERHPQPALEAVFFSPKPPSVEEEVAVRVKRGDEYVTEDRLKLLLNLTDSPNPYIFPNPPKKLHHQRYRQTPSGLTLEGVSVFPFLSLDAHLQQALSPDPRYERFTNRFYIPHILVRPFPYYSTDPTFPPSEAVGEHRKRLYVYMPIKDVQPLIKAAILDRQVEKVEKVARLEEVRCKIEQDLARVNGLIDQLSPDYVALEVLTYKGYLKNLTGGNRLALSAGQTQTI